MDEDPRSTYWRFVVEVWQREQQSLRTANNWRGEFEFWCAQRKVLEDQRYMDTLPSFSIAEKVVLDGLAESRLRLCHHLVLIIVIFLVRFHLLPTNWLYSSKALTIESESDESSSPSTCDWSDEWSDEVFGEVFGESSVQTDIHPDSID